MLPSISAFALGAASWSLAEYSLHRWLGHAPRAGRKKEKVGLFDGDFGSEHQAHHADTRYFTPTTRKLKTALVVIPAIGAVGSFVVGPGRAWSFALGLGVTYAAYEITHRRTHTHAPTGPYSRWTRRHHLHHHFENPRSNHGVTSPIWDWVFGTLVEPGVIRVPERHAPRWLFDPTSGELDRRYAADYSISTRTRAEPEAVV